MAECSGNQLKGDLALNLLINFRSAYNAKPEGIKDCFSIVLKQIRFLGNRPLCEKEVYLKCLSSFCISTNQMRLALAIEYLLSLDNKIDIEDRIYKEYSTLNYDYYRNDMANLKRSMSILSDRVAMLHKDITEYINNKGDIKGGQYPIDGMLITKIKDKYKEFFTPFVQIDRILAEYKSFDQVPINELDISTRLYSLLSAGKVKKLIDIPPPKELMKFRNFGVKALSEILKVMVGLEVWPESIIDDCAKTLSPKQFRILEQELKLFR
jgi:hypothetical protein